MVATKIPIKVQKRSGFDKGHHNALNQYVGTITPILVDEVIPNSKVSLRYAIAGSMPPLATDTYMKTYYDVRAFFVPFRLLSGSFESWFSDYEYPSIIKSGGANTVSTSKAFLPYFNIDPAADLTGILGINTLADHLGYKLGYSGFLPVFDENIVISAMPFLAYHRICNDWFRQPNITKEFFARPSGTLPGSDLIGNAPYFVSMSPFVPLTTVNDAAIPVVSDVSDPNLSFADGVSIFSLRQANFDYDYFTNALPSAQLGTPMSVNTTGNTFTISQLRVMNSLQQFAELNMLSGSSLVDIVKARYGANLSRGVAQRCVYLGGSRLDIGSKSVDVNSGNTVLSNNPFIGDVGASAGKAYVQGTDLIIDNFTAEEPGFIFVVGTIIPKVTYGTGIRRYLRHYISAGSLVDMANPLLQNTGNQPIYAWELTGCLGLSTYSSDVFGFTDHYAEFMTMEDEVHGELSRAGTLSSFVAQRSFAPNATQPVISTSFLEVPTTALNNVTAVSASLSSYGFYGQIAFDYKVSQPLAQYSLPSLQNPAYEHGQTIMVHRGGFRF